MVSAIQLAHKCLRPSIAVGFTYLILLGVFWKVHDYGVIDFVRLGTVWGENNPSGPWGYDGQFYYQIARNPLGAATYMDNAPYRYQRILYPLVVHLLSAGRLRFIPHILLLVNYISIVVSVEIVSHLFRVNERNQWFSMGYGLFFGLAVGLTFSTAEPFTGFLICLAFLFNRQNHWGAALMFGLASLSRETALLFPVGYMVFYCVRKEWIRALAMALLGITPLIVWLVCLRFIFGETGLGFAPPFEPLPFFGIFVQSETPRKFSLLIITILIPAAAAMFLGVRELIRGRFDPVLLSFILNTALIVFLSRLSTADLVAPSRIAVGMMLGGVVYAATNKRDMIALAFLYNIFTFIVYLAGVFASIQSLYL